MISKQYPGKVLFLGEYSLLFGSKGLVVPFYEVNGSWIFSSDEKKKDEDLLLFYEHSHKSHTELKFDWEQFRVDIENGLSFQSSIPTGAGLGSSGALIAAFYDRYGKNNPDVVNQGVDLNFIRDNLAILESFHHNKSSGIDPLVSWLQRPLLLNGMDRISILNELTTESQWMKKNNFSVYLLPTSGRRKTSIWVEKFRLMLELKDFNSWLKDKYVPLVNLTVETMLDRNASFFKLIFNLCMEQKNMMSYFMQDTIISEIYSKYSNYKVGIKLCGAGGGGHYLLFTHNLPKTVEDELAQSYSLKKVF